MKLYEYSQCGGEGVQSYRVPVRNEHTGEVRVVEICSGYGTDAQIEALQTLFRQEGWRKAVALQPEWSLDEAQIAV
jgi:hypothetical protein